MNEPTTTINLSLRIRPNCEAAPWVIDEVKLLEKRLETAEATLKAVAELPDKWLALATDDYADDLYDRGRSNVNYQNAMELKALLEKTNDP